ncbi:uncharacterized protein CC84DRAFT_1116691 [Paraphaeosphaeria sporulosa]|uniref:Zn(2)-C6 fungal-type domain-containing protein n=1 Tax=Paraphaeosphaeria sporulosa TaxID=1460663 RepID=A0A177CHV8_9PLEO|nr:uncharacterized protein CC84DRAFT_1116691 [Paraphaeosphaeria sporulosa]OAG06821.1 hypothetical protein CC84DRAFT_1116691 [Paraphaeosphaeria sporulosa]
MPKQRQTCTRCSQRRQKCDRKSPCTRCVLNNEAHLCTTVWKEGYNPAVHRRYPKKPSPTTSQSLTDPSTSAEVSPSSGIPWPAGQIPLHFRSKAPGNQSAGDASRGGSISTSSDGVAGSSDLPNTSSNNVDFITYGRSEFTNISMGTLLDNKEEYTRHQSLMDETLNQSRTKTVLDEAATETFSPAAQAAEVYHLQSVLPTKEQVFQMIDYHQNCMAYWIGGIYHGPSLRQALLEAYGDNGHFDLRCHDWRWCALLFSILSASIIGSPEEVSNSWGFSNADKLKLSRQWGNSLISCLQLGDFASRHHIYSVQAILNMHTSEHLVGSAKEWAVYQAASTVIARGLGLNKLGRHPEDQMSPSEMTTEQKDALIQREIGRRVWSALISQDWLCSTSQGMYTQQKRHYSSIPPRHFDEETWEPVVSYQKPTFTHVSNYLNEIAHVLVRYLDDMMDAGDIESKYNVVLRYDAIMRGLCIEKMPPWLSLNMPHNNDWPEWTKWVRRSYHASCAHKIIMIHQSFLGRSFKDPRYTYSRWACISSAKTVLEAMEKRLPNEPQWWVEQAFVVTAGLCLGLDLFHRAEGEPEAIKDLECIQKAVQILEQWPTSSVAAHGIRLLTTLLQEHSKKADASRSESRAKDPEFPPNIAPQAIADAASVDSPRPSPVPLPPPAPTELPISDEVWANGDFDIDMSGFEELMDTLPLQNGFDNSVFLDTLWNGYTV